ncbi:MAG TPA: sigma-54 dependent transcriptional regulator [Thermodesulfobacteriota bacterium]|nr:sigma-54 dependent transcriptional regulator [Thermodesulfobacteriota bacterium]
MHKCNVLVVDDDEELVNAVKELLERKGYEIITAFSGKEAIDKMSSFPQICAALLDLVMPMMDGFTLLDEVKENHPETNAIIITGHGTVPNAVEAIKRGAMDFITKPFDKDLLLKKLEVIKKTHELENRITELKGLLSEKYGFEQIISSSRLMGGVFERATAAARTDASVFIVGETGTGKELLAKAIHLKSERSNQPFVAVNCAAIPKELMESELFGYKKGSFTGAMKDHDGLFMAANRGTIFLDEIGEMPRDLQVKLLRVLEEHKIRPIGYTSEIQVDIRIIAASNRSIEELKNTYLREDLFFRLAVVVIELPPLRERREDIPLLTEYFIRKFNDRYSRSIKGVSEGVFTSLYRYHFPGNIRELENLIEGIIAISPPEKETITEKDLKAHLVWQETKPLEHTLLSLEKLERFALEQALRESQGNKSKASEILGISRDTLYRKLKQFGIE